MRVFLKPIILAFMAYNSLFALEDALDELSLEDMLDMETELTADIGSRSGATSLLRSASPTDVIIAKQIEASGLTSLTDVLRYFVPGFNAPETSVADGSDHVRVFTLRGMAPDQILVLVNGKRYHNSALLHVNGTIGKGSTGVDLDTIIPSSIEKIEILRDGAAAQYGSDAISGVISIVLKGTGHENKVSVHAGQRRKGDGTQLNTDIFLTIPLKYDGFVNLTMQAKGQEQTQRAGPDKRANAPAFNTHVGIPDSKNFLATINVEIPQENNTNIYTNTIVSYRDSEASTFSRETNATYPNGFLPILGAEILDYSIAAGVKGEFGYGYYWDISNIFGYNNIDYSMKDTTNYSLGGNSPSSFDNGSLRSMQNTTNLDMKTIVGPFNLAYGLEYRKDWYSITAGEVSSYIDGGSQGFSGYQPQNEVDVSRTSYAAYFEGKYDVTDAITATVAARYENFSDFGETTNAKLALTYQANEELFFRTSASTGSRALSLAQSNYSHISSFGGTIEGTFTRDNEIAQTFCSKLNSFNPNGAVANLFCNQELKAESSKHFTLGTVYEASENTYFMIDYFLTTIDDRIVLSNEFILSAAAQAAIGTNVSGARFFSNALNTKTEGIDIKLYHEYEFEDATSIYFNIWYNYSKNSVTSFNTPAITRANFYEQIDRMENGQPKDSLRILSTYSLKDIDSTVNVSRYGSYSQVIDNQAYKFDPAWTLDLDFTYKVEEGFKVSLGAINVLDTLPNKWDGLSGDKYGSDGIKPYSRYSPFGYSGAYYYVRANLTF